MMSRHVTDDLRPDDVPGDSERYDVNVGAIREVEAQAVAGGREMMDGDLDLGKGLGKGLLWGRCGGSWRVGRKDIADLLKKDLFIGTFLHGFLLLTALLAAFIRAGTGSMLRVSLFGVRDGWGMMIPCG
jgi:hypothetical protein